MMSNLKIRLIVIVAIFLAPNSLARQTSDLEDNDFIKVDELISFQSDSLNESRELISGRRGKSKHAYYSYDNGPGTKNWGGYCAFGKAQSPIDLNEDQAVIVTLEELRFTNANNTPKSTEIINSGHSIKMKLITESPILVSGGPLGDKIYQFQQLHLHWGKNMKNGCEHTIDSKRLPLEAHLVFFKLGSTDALNEIDGITVLSVQYDISSKENPILNTITDSLVEVVNPEQSVDKAGGHTLFDWLPNDLDSYFTYKGSLTTPPCSEVVTWIVFTNRLNVTKKQVSQLKMMKDELGHNVMFNFREIQPLNGRVVSLSKPSK